jgi:hypothetical protein
VGHIAARYDLNTHSDTCCAGTNRSLMELTGKIYDVNSFLESYQLISKYRWHVVALYGQTKMTVWNIYLLETGPLLFRAVINDFTSIGQWCPPHAGTQQHSTNPTWHSYWLVQP